MFNPTGAGLVSLMLVRFRLRQVPDSPLSSDRRDEA